MYYYDAALTLLPEARELGPRPDVDGRIGVNFRYQGAIYSGYAVVGTRKIEPSSTTDLCLLILKDDLRTGDVVDVLVANTKIGTAKIRARVEGDYRLAP